MERVQFEEAQELQLNLSSSQIQQNSFEDLIKRIFSITDDQQDG